MAGSVPPSRRPILESFTATVSIGGHDFAFVLHTRPLSLGPKVIARYYWMDSSGFRITRSKRSADPANFRNCISHWLAVLQATGNDRDPIQISHLIRATCFGLISGGKAMQQGYRDAHLAAGATTPEQHSLPEEVLDRIKAVVRSRDRTRVQEELDEVLGRADIDGCDVRPLRDTFDLLIQVGIELIRKDGNEGLRQFVARFDAWSMKHRKKGGQSWLRLFLNLFAYECKVSFYLCYANAWISLIPWLQQHCGLDKISERLLRLWHMQNQPIEQPDGSVLPDVFRGQVLSLHPLSGFFMKDPALCAVAGRFFASRRYDEACTGSLPSYWKLVHAVLTAANLYRQAADEQANCRGVRRRGGDAVDGIGGADDGGAHEALLREFAAAQNVTCPVCNRAVQFEGYTPVMDEVQFPIHYTCRHCHRSVETMVQRDALVRWLLPAN